MSKRIALLLMLLVLAVAGTGCGLLQEPAAPSAPIEAVPLDVATQPAPVEEVAPTALAPEPTADAPEPTADAPEPTADAPEPTGETATAAPRVFTIDQGGSEVRFELDEDLRGERITVIGFTQQVAGELALDPADLSQTQVGTLQINARTLLTDNNFRNRAIQNEILDTGEFEFISFVPTSVDGLPDTVAVGETVQFTISGDLTVRDVTLPATFAVEATLVSADQVTGTASTVIPRGDYGLNIPSVPNVANVEEEVELYIDFTANAS
jgi:polyisoprenoid-binding protein YceI